jgi:molybdate transport system substrate-binding protein
MSRWPRLAAWVTAGSLLLVACSSSAKPTASAPATPTTVGPSTTTTPTRRGLLTVFAAASLTGPFTAAKAAVVSANPGLNLSFSFAGSNALVAQITQGAPADVFASADEPNMQKLVTSGLVETPVIFARNKLQIAVAAGNPKHITGLADLARADVIVVLEAPGVPAGDYTRQALAAQQLKVSPRSLETDVKSALAKVSAGEADATVVYVTDVTAAGAKISGVSIPDAQNVTATYPIAVVKATPNPAAARAFVQSAVSGSVQQALQAAGFSPA